MCNVFSSGSLKGERPVHRCKTLAIRVPCRASTAFRTAPQKNSFNIVTGIPVYQILNW